MLAPGRHVRRRAGHFRARSQDLWRRIYSPLGPALRECAVCHRLHLTTSSACSTLAQALRCALTRFGIAGGDAAAIALDITTKGGLS